MKNYIGNCTELNEAEESPLSKYFSDASQMAYFVEELCEKRTIGQVKNQLKLPKDLEENINKRPDDFEFGLYQGVEDGMVFIYDKDQDIHYFFI